ncbi:MAG TPA: site-2 protease family protein [Chloroflexota bacterium]|nr:site-2 protease family protein [Chloroflexota bacterium]HZU07810.1 site-2 protease family protein [Chloroflexota bacterium]
MFGLTRLSPIQIVVLLLIGFVLLGAPILGLLYNPQRFLALIIALVVGITVHEAAHALVAVALGDPTPRLMGRLSLNPLRHLDPIGSLALLVASFGWGKPVVFDPRRLRTDPRLGSALVAVAGPIANILMALLAVVLLKNGSVALGEAGAQVLQMLFAVNVGLAAFNLLPIPPLDGFGFVENLLPKPLAAALAPLVPYGPLVLLALIFLGPPLFHRDVLGELLRPIQSTIVSLILAVPGVR